MQDEIILGTGNSRYLKSVSDFMTRYPTYADFCNALVAGTLPIDFNGKNSEGIAQQGTPLNKANLLSDATASAINAENPPIAPDEAFALLSGRVTSEAENYEADSLFRLYSRESLPAYNASGSAYETYQAGFKSSACDNGHTLVALPIGASGVVTYNTETGEILFSNPVIPSGIASTNWHKVIYAKGMFVLVGNSSDSAGKFLLTAKSTDGINWQSIGIRDTVSGSATNWQLDIADICYDAIYDRFYAINGAYYYGSGTYPTVYWYGNDVLNMTIKSFNAGYNNNMLAPGSIAVDSLGGVYIYGRNSYGTARRQIWYSAPSEAGNYSFSNIRGLQTGSGSDYVIMNNTNEDGGDAIVFEYGQSSDFVYLCKNGTCSQLTAPRNPRTIALVLNSTRGYTKHGGKLVVQVNVYKNSSSSTEIGSNSEWVFDATGFSTTGELPILKRITFPYTRANNSGDCVVYMEDGEYYGYRFATTSAKVTKLLAKGVDNIGRALTFTTGSYIGDGRSGSPVNLVFCECGFRPIFVYWQLHDNASDILYLSTPKRISAGAVTSASIVFYDSGFCLPADNTANNANSTNVAGLTYYYFAIGIKEAE